MHAQARKTADPVQLSRNCYPRGVAGPMAAILNVGMKVSDGGGSPAPDEASSAQSIDSIDLSLFVAHRGCARADTPLEDLEKIFRAKDVDFLALVSDGRVVGMCSRVRLGAMLGSRYGFALFSKSPACELAVKNPLIFPIRTPVREVLAASLARLGGDFHENVALVDEDCGLIGLIPVERLAHLQSRLVQEQLQQLESQRDTLNQQNVKMFQANHALRQAQGLSWGLFHSNTIGIALLDSRGQLQAHNSRLSELLNLGPEPVAIASVEGWMAEADRRMFESMLTEHERTGDAGMAPLTREITLQVPGKGPRLFRFTTGWIRETGQVCACVDDVTEQRMLERKMMRQEKQRLLDTLVGGIAHELNNKLTPIQGFAELLANRAFGETREHLLLVDQCVQEASRIVRQLLQLSKPETEKLVPLDLGAVIEESLLILKFQLRKAGCQVHFSRAPEPVIVLADAGQLKQILINLLMNALQAMEAAAEPAISLSVRRAGETVAITVADNGPGIHPEHLGRIFDPFFTTKGPDRGTGLGLSICFSVARQYGGDISVESVQGSGATFTVTLPAYAGGLMNGPDLPTAAPVRQGRRRCRILVVDDEVVVQLLLQEMLRSNFICDIDLASSGGDALSLAARGNYDLIVSDVRMPGMSGPEFYRQLRESRPELAGRFVFITGYQGEAGLQEEITRWKVPVLAKPFTQSGLLEVCMPHLAPESEFASA